MGRLVYSAITSLDGFVNDAEGGFDWSAPDEEVHAFVNDLERPVGTYLYGRRMYDTMVAWETMEPGSSAAGNDYAQLWRAADKVVWSTTLEQVRSARTRIERTFDAEAVRAMVAASPADVSVGGPGLAAHALRAELVDEVHLLLCPVVVGGGTRALPDGLRLDLELLDVRRFSGGVVHLHHRVRPATG